MALRIVKKSKDRHIRCTILGYVYDDRIIKKEWVKDERRRHKTFKKRMVCKIQKKSIFL